MNAETTVILLTLVLAFIHLGIPPIFRMREVGIMPLAGGRDGVPTVQHRLGQRAERANHNFKESLPWALSILLLVQVVGVTNDMTATGAWLYVISRAIYLPMYVFGIPFLRTLAWFASIVGIGVMAWQLLPG